MVEELTAEPDLAISLRANPSAPRRARQAVVGSLEPSVGHKFAHDVSLLVSELVTNSILHGPPHPDDGVEVKLWQRGDTIRVEVIDQGPGFDLRGIRESPPDTAGLGLFLVETLADRWGMIREGRTRVWFELSPKPA